MKLPARIKNSLLVVSKSIITGIYCHDGRSTFHNLFHDFSFIAIPVNDSFVKFISRTPIGTTWALHYGKKGSKIGKILTHISKRVNPNFGDLE